MKTNIGFGFRGRVAIRKIFREWMNGQIAGINGGSGLGWVAAEVDD
jgi:hypothetical protein